MDIEVLLNPADELHVMDEVTDEVGMKKISKIHRKMDQSMAGMMILKMTHLWSPTYRQVLQDATVITRYIENMDDPITRKLKMILGSFGHQMCLEESRSMIPTSLTDFFSHK
jgi:hypothetical protein